MAQVRAEAGETDVLAGNGDTVFGTNIGGESYRVAGRSGLVSFQGGFLEGEDTIFLEGPPQAWSARAGGGGSFISLTRGPLEVRIPVPEAGNANIVVFTDDILFGEASEGIARPLFYDDAKASVVLGNQEIGGTAEPVSAEADPTPAPTVAEVEPNSVISQAQRLDRDDLAPSGDQELADPSLPSIRVQGSITAGDTDFYSIQLNAGEQLILDVDGTTSLDSVLRVYNPSGAEVASDDDSGFDPGSTSEVDPFLSFPATGAGTYSFSLEGFDESEAGSYILNVSIAPASEGSIAAAPAAAMAALDAGRVFAEPDAMSAPDLDPVAARALVMTLDFLF